MQFSPQMISFDSPFFDQDEAIDTPPLPSLNLQNSQTPQQSGEEDPQDDSDVAFDYDLLLPPPNPLPQKALPTRDPLQVFYEYPIWKIPKFTGKEQADKPSSLDRQDIMKKYTKKFNDKPKDNKVNVEGGDEDIPEEPKKLSDFFADEEKIVYRRRSQGLDESFNQTCYNLRTQPKRNVEDTEMGWENVGENDVKGNYGGQNLRFESRFESGNLSMVSFAGENEYNMILQSDINTFGYGQWFFFAVSNTRKNQTVKFNIMNYRKMGSLHNHGMRIFVYSTKEAKKSNTGWTKTTNAEYYRNHIKRENTKNNKSFRTLSFEYTFKHDTDCVFFAYGQPYTYTDLLDYLDSVETDSYKSKYFGRSTLCKTLAGNKCELVTITGRKTPDSEKKKCIFLAARVHPGEPNSSFVIQGVMDFLLSNSKEAESLREKFIFKIIPMLNPDGVIHGNSRCSLTGCDLNRKWQKPSPKLHPTIYFAKRLASELNRKYGVLLFCDFHGHSKRKDMFLYGCQVGNLPIETRVFAWVLSKLSPFFSYRKSSFFIESSKLGAARVCLYQDLKIKYSYTLETSFYGPEKGRQHFTIQDLLEFGGHFCKAILLQLSKECGSSKKQLVKEIDEECEDLKRKMVEEFYSTNEHLINGEPDSGSESEISDDDLPSTRLRALLPKTKKRGISLKKGGRSPSKPNKVLSSFADMTKSPKNFSDKSSFNKEKSSQKLLEAKRIVEKSPLPIQKFKNLSILGSITNEAPTLETQDPYNLTANTESKRQQGTESIVFQQEMKPKAERERESKSIGTPKERRLQNASDAVLRKSGSCAVVNLGEIPSFCEKSLMGLSGLKHIRNLRQFKSGREFKILSEGVWDSQVYQDERLFQGDAKADIEKEPKDQKEEKIFASAKCSRENSEEPRAPTRSKAVKKPRGPYMLEPLGKGMIFGDFEKFDMESTKSPFKTNKTIRHPGFSRKVEEDFTGKDLMLSRNTSSIFGTSPKWDNFGGLDKWKFNMKAGEEATKNNGKEGKDILSGVKGMNILDKDIKEDFGEYMFLKEKLKKEDTTLRKGSAYEQFRTDKKMKNMIKPSLVYTSARQLEIKIPGSLVSSPNKSDFGSLKALSTTQKVIPNKPW